MKFFDIFPKTYDEFKIKTFSGGIITIISLFLITVLFLSEFYFYLTPIRTDELYVDTTYNNKIEIYLNITYPAISCDALSVDVMDVAGEVQTNVENTIYKRRLSLNGEILGDYKLEKKLDLVAPTKEGYCGGCFGALPPGQCCNTCDAVKEAYQKKGWQFHIEDFEQCLQENNERKLKYSKSEGCNLHGFIMVNKVAGNFHFSPGKSLFQGQMQIHDYTEFEKDHFNTSHIIHSLGFGEKYPGIHNPLDDVEKYIKKGSGLFQYFIKVVPTIYETLSEQLYTNQYSVTQHFRPYNSEHPNVVPGVFFIYDLSPIMVHISFKKRSFLHFTTNIFAILGGVYTLSLLLDMFLFEVEKKSKLLINQK